MLNKIIIVALILALGFWIVVLFLSSNQSEIIPKEFKARSDHEAYWHSLKQASLSQTALGKDWLRSSEVSLFDATRIKSPFETVFYLDPAEAGALGYRMAVRKGQKIEIFLDHVSGDSLTLFMDLFRIEDRKSEPYKHVATANRTFDIFFEAGKDAEYVLRLQPELLRGGRFRLTLRSVPSLSFPVSGKDRNAIHSYFGDPRDGGRRKHHGVDIFADRHTPVISPADGYIRFAGEKGLGGKVVWMYDANREQTLYFAHLNECRVQSRSYVKAGDTIGTVGNSGNARTTPPHLHFGIYQRGPLNPYYFISDLNTGLDPIDVDTSLIGRIVRTNRRSTLVPVENKARKIQLNKYQLLKTLAAFGSDYYVQLPDGTRGTIHYKYIEPANEPIAKSILDDDYPLIVHPDHPDVSGDLIACGEEFGVYGYNRDLRFVRDSNGAEGWMAE